MATGGLYFLLGLVQNSLWVRDGCMPAAKTMQQRIVFADKPNYLINAATGRRLDVTESRSAACRLTLTVRHKNPQQAQTEEPDQADARGSARWLIYLSRLCVT